MAKDISKLDELREFIAKQVASGRFPDEESALARALELLRQDEQTPAARKRQGGQWKGQVTIAPDFDDLPDDIAESFGMK